MRGKKNPINNHSRNAHGMPIVPVKADAFNHVWEWHTEAPSSVIGHTGMRYIEKIVAEYCDPAKSKIVINPSKNIVKVNGYFADEAIATKCVDEFFLIGRYFFQVSTTDFDSIVAMKRYAAAFTSSLVTL